MTAFGVGSVGSVCRTETMHQLLCFKSRFPNHSAFTLGRYLSRRRLIALSGNEALSGGHVTSRLGLAALVPLPVCLPSCSNFRSYELSHSNLDVSIHADPRILRRDRW